MNEKNQFPPLNGGVHLSRMPHKLNQLPYKPIITLAVDKLTQSIIGFSIHKTAFEKNFRIHTRQLKVTPINSVRNAMARHSSDNPGYFSIDNSPEFSSASYGKAMKELALQQKPAWNNKVVGTIEIDHTLADIFVTLSQPLPRYSRPSPKNPPFGELWRQRGRRLPQS
jgi:hypothetical protein